MARWALSPSDHRSHAVGAAGPGPVGEVVALCGHEMPASVPVGPSPQLDGAMCTQCAAILCLALTDPPQFGRDDREKKP